MMKKVAFCEKKNGEFDEIKDFLQSSFVYQIDESNPDIVFCIGGDGTFLDAVSKYGVNPLYIPINMGSLGFYCSWGENNLEELLSDYDANNILKAYMIEVVLIDKNNTAKTHLCLNETTIINTVNTQILEVFINSNILEHFRGTGVCVSTPTGSTGYNKSLGGAIISSSKKLYQLTHIATINNVVYRSVENSIILDDTEFLSFEGDFSNAVVSIDRASYKIDDIKKIDVTLSQRYVKILVPNNKNFYDRVRKAFIG